MYIKKLKLHNVGPFKDAELLLLYEKVDGRMPITVITGENGTGKSIIIDAIRALFKAHFGIDRDIVANPDDFSAEMVVHTDRDYTLESTNYIDHRIHIGDSHFARYFSQNASQAGIVNWVVDYWHSTLGTDSFTINSLASIDVDKALVGTLDKSASNVELTKFICSIDYLRSSEDVKDATVYVCKSENDHSVVEDETNDYSNLPVDEVLNTPVFSVGPFNDEITELLRKRKKALQEGRKDEAEQYAQQLLAIKRCGGF